MAIYCSSGIQGNSLLGPYRTSGYYTIALSGQSPYNMYVNNVDNDGGWVLAAVVRTGDDRAHWNTGAVNVGNDTVDGLAVGVKAYDASTSKMSDAWMNAFRAASPYNGTTAYWLQALSWSGGSGYDGYRNMFISSNATIDSVSSAQDQNARTICSTTYEGTLSDRAPNSGTRGLGDHHTGVPYFAYCRHPESSNPGFRQDTLGQSDGYLWIK